MEWRQHSWKGGRYACTEWYLMPSPDPACPRGDRSALSLLNSTTVTTKHPLPCHPFGCCLNCSLPPSLRGMSCLLCRRTRELEASPLVPSVCPLPALSVWWMSQSEFYTWEGGGGGVNSRWYNLCSLLCVLGGLLFCATVCFCVPYLSVNLAQV